MFLANHIKCIFAVSKKNIRTVDHRSTENKIE